MVGSTNTVLAAYFTDISDNVADNTPFKNTFPFRTGGIVNFTTNALQLPLKDIVVCRAQNETQQSIIAVEQHRLFVKKSPFEFFIWK